MSKLNDNYYLRNCFLKQDQVPTQSFMRNKMGTSLANVYFKSMTPTLKVLAGLEPLMKGGGSDWYMPPKDLLQGKAVLKPLKKEYLSKLSCNGIAFFAETLIENYRNGLELEKRKALEENDDSWMKLIETKCKEHWQYNSFEESKRNTIKIQQAFQEFTTLYRTSITKIETKLNYAALKEIERVKSIAYNKMAIKFETLLKQQATMLYDRYHKMLTVAKSKLKDEFIRNIETAQTTLDSEIHDINVEKHIAVEKLRTLLEYQNLACQVYVALKERDELNKKFEISQHKHKKKLTRISDEINIKAAEIQQAKEKIQNQKDFNLIWQRKICHIVKRFQEFVKYCLKELPDHADFFLNMEKLMLLQLSQATENPSAESIYEYDKDKFSAPVPRPHPFFLICDKGYKPNINEKLCPKHCTSSASQMPVIVVNKRCVYAACDNLEIFSNRIRQFLDGKRGDDNDFVDDHDYTYDIPINCTSSDQLLDLQLESSLMQILQNELPNVKKVPVECGVCKTLYCFCSPDHPSNINILNTSETQVKNDLTSYVDPGTKITLRANELKHFREPNIASYLEYVRPRPCKCAKTAKKHLQVHLPAYMRNTSNFEKVNLPHYEPCSLDQLKKLVKKARNGRPTSPVLPKQESKTRNISTQYSDQKYEILCNCVSDAEVKKIYHELATSLKLYTENVDPKYKVFDKSLSSVNFDKRPSSFATSRALSLRQLIDKSPDLEEIFKRDQCL